MMNASNGTISASDIAAAGSSRTSGSPKLPGLKSYIKTPEGRYKFLFDKTCPYGTPHANAKAATQVTVANLKEKSPPPSLASPPTSLSKSHSARSVAARFLGSSNDATKGASHIRSGSLSDASVTSNSLSNSDGSGTYIIFNFADAIFISDLLSQDKEPYKSIYLGSSSVICHAFDEDAREGHDLLIGTHVGEVLSLSLRQQLREPGRRLTGANQYNKDGSVNNSRCTSVAWVPKGDGVFVAAHADGNLYVYDKNKETTADLNFPLSKDPNQFSVSHARNSKCNPIARWHICEGSINSIAFSSDGNYLATVGRDGYLRIFHYKKEQLVCGGKSYYGALLCCAWSDDGKYIIIGGEDDLVQVWSMGEKRMVAWGEGHNSWVRGVSFDSHWAAEGNVGNAYRLGSVGEDTQLVLWDMEGDEMVERAHEVNDGMLRPALSMRDVPKLSPVLAQRVHSDALSGVVFTPHCVLTACRDGRVKAWTRPVTNLGSS